MSPWFRRIASASLACTLPAFASAPAPAAIVVGSAQRLPTYTIVALPPFGGDQAQANSIDGLDVVAGIAEPSGDAVTHAAFWLGAHPFDLGTLAGPSVNSAIAWRNHDEQPLLAGVSELATPEPLGEAWSCPAFFFGAATGRECVGFYDTPWSGMRALPTLGGYDGVAAGTNDESQIVGWAETTYHDPTCQGAGAGPGAQILQFLATRWDPPYAKATVLQPLAGDSDTAATAIDDAGTAVGISGACDQAVGRYTARHVVRWRNGTVERIPFAPTLGGAAWNTPDAISNTGEVVGFANLRSNRTATFAPHAFSWTEQSGMRDLGTLAGDQVSLGNGVNDRGEVVGLSGSRAFVEIGSTMVDLNTLVSGTTPYYLLAANDVNDSGVIVGQACVAARGGGCASDATYAFMAIPHGTCALDARRMATRSVRLPAAITQGMLRRYAGFSMPG